MRTPLTSVGDLLFGQTRRRVLALLYGAVDETFFVRQVARQVETFRTRMPRLAQAQPPLQNLPG